MNDVSGVMLTGVLLGIAVFGAKSGIGCGLSSLSRRELVGVAGAYLLMAVVASMLAGSIFSHVGTAVLTLGVAMHALMGIVLIVGGMHTVKSYVCNRRDITRRTFLIISAPCPVCLAATFLACSVLQSLGDMGPLKVGTLVGAAFALSIGTASYAARRIRGATARAPALLGNIMMFLGMFYVLSILVIPSYLQTQSLSVVSAASSAATLSTEQLLTSVLVLGGFTALGFGVSKWAKRWC